ncbi:MAG TPA: hypothetical protein VFS64_02460 [Solirubrobacterales bacterium]|nr:hypothetical protein [Solirubrobacterales bacterium]
MAEEPEEKVKPPDGGTDGPAGQRVIAPFHMGVMQAQEPGTPAGHPVAVAATVDFDLVPGLREVRDRIQSGEEFDTSTHWWTSHPPRFKSPLAILTLEMPQIDFRFDLGIEVDTYSPALMAAVQTKMIMLIDRKMEHRLRTRNPLKVADSSIAFEVDDVESLRRILLQRLDFGEQDRDEARVDEPAGDLSENAERAEFLKVISASGLPTIIVLVDPQLEVEKVRDLVSSEPNFDGQWTARKNDQGSLVRLDCALGEKPVGSWWIPDPPQELVRAAAAGDHVVVVLKKPIRIGSYMRATARLARKGIPIVAGKASKTMFELMG